MSSFSSCLGCGRTLKKSLTGGAFFEVQRCRSCGRRYCHKCGGKKCPKCESASYVTIGKVYAK